MWSRLQWWQQQLVVVGVIVSVRAEYTRSLDSLGLCLPLIGALGPGPQDFRSFWLPQGCQGEVG